MKKKMTFEEQFQWYQRNKPIIKATVCGALIGAGVASAVFIVTRDPKTAGDAAIAVVNHYF